MAAAAKTRPSLEPAPSCRGRGVALGAVQRDEDHPQEEHYASQTAIYINALIMVLKGVRRKHEVAEREAFFFYWEIRWLLEETEAAFTDLMVISSSCS